MSAIKICFMLWMDWENRIKKYKKKIESEIYALNCLHVNVSHYFNLNSNQRSTPILISK